MDLHVLRENNSLQHQLCSSSPCEIQREMKVDGKDNQFIENPENIAT